MHDYGNGASLRKPHPEGEFYDPVGYKKVINSYWTGNVVFFAFALLALLSFAASWGSFETPTGFIIFIILAVLFGIPYYLYYDNLLNRHEAAVAAEKERRGTQIAHDLSIAMEKTRETTKLLEDQMKELEKIKAAQMTGDVIVHGNQAPVFISSNVVNSFNTIATNDPELAAAIKTLGGYIEQSGNKEAARYFNELHEKVALGDNNKTVLKALWLGITAALPDVAALTDVVAKIKGLFE